MAIRKNAAKAAPVAAFVPAASLDVDQRIDIVSRLTAANAKERILILSALPMGEVAAIGGRIASIGASVNEVLNIKMCEKHGTDWAHIAKAIPSSLCDADKERRKAINASLEAIRETVKANAAGDAQKASETIRRVKEWGLGIRKSKSGANANKKAPIEDWAVAWENGPSAYRRIMKDDMENVTPERSEALLAIADAYAAYFKLCGIQPQAVIDCSGKTAWQH